MPYGVVTGVKMLPSADRELVFIQWSDDEGDQVAGDGSTSGDVLVVGYVAEDDDDIEDGDTLNEALAKLAARIQALEDA